MTKILNIEIKSCSECPMYEHRRSTYWGDRVPTVTDEHHCEMILKLSRSMESEGTSYIKVLEKYGSVVIQNDVKYQDPDEPPNFKQDFTKEIYIRCPLPNKE
ncbi:hypothetical protein M0R01_03645 [bacterium]|nr:hypothetical protein [bacterium]